MNEMAVLALSEPKVYDMDLEARDWAWLQSKYPGTCYKRYTGNRAKVWRLVSVSETTGPCTFTVHCVDAAGRGVPGIVVGHYWTGATAIQVPESNERWYATVGQGQLTDSGGKTDFPLGSGNIYGSSGACDSAWVLSHLYGADLYDRWGWMPMTNHNGPLVVTFALVDNGSAPTPEPEDGWVAYNLRVGPFTLPVSLRKR